MLLKYLDKVYISQYTEINDHGEKTKSWSYKGSAMLNLQQDVNELDRKSTGEVDYSIIHARSDRVWNIAKGDGISLTDISESNNISPDYRVIDITKIGNTLSYRLEKMQ